MAFYKSLTEDLELEIQDLKADLRVANLELAAIENKLDTAEAQNTFLRRQLDLLENENEQLRQRIQDYVMDQINHDRNSL